MQRKLSASMSALLTTVTCLILGGSIFALYGTVLRPNTFRTQATIVASHFLTAQVRATLQATTQALASATAFQNLYMRTVSNQPVYSFSLNEQENGSLNPLSSQTGGCAFIKGAYHIFETERYFSEYCLSPVGTLIDFAFQVQITLIKGDEGGIIFGMDAGTNPTNLNYFGIDYAGDYSLVNESDQQLHILLHGFNRIINANPDRANLLTITVRHGVIYLYVNDQYVDSFSNTSYNTSGLAGLFVTDYVDPTEAAFNNIQIWRL